MTIVVVTHELESAFKIADYITILGTGKVLESGTPQQIRCSQKPEIQALLNRTPRENILDSDAYLRALTGETIEPETKDEG
jgi:phospholipid/cholesterol/gamma-HCH transport system ATP-binding protein